MKEMKECMVDMTGRIQTVVLQLVTHSVHHSLCLAAATVVNRTTETLAAAVQRVAAATDRGTLIKFDIPKSVCVMPMWRQMY